MLYQKVINRQKFTYPYVNAYSKMKAKFKFSYPYVNAHGKMKTLFKEILGLSLHNL